jgi:hypothetical protein
LVSSLSFLLLFVAMHVARQRVSISTLGELPCQPQCNKRSLPLVATFSVDDVTREALFSCIFQFEHLFAPYGGLVAAVMNFGNLSEALENWEFSRSHVHCERIFPSGLIPFVPHISRQWAKQP